MIPPLNDQGYLPNGVHRATLEEIAKHFGQASELRRVEMESIGWLVDLARRAGAQRLIVNGSFVTDRLEPNDVDCVLLLGDDYPVDPTADQELARRRTSVYRLETPSGGLIRRIRPGYLRFGSRE